MDSLFNYTYLYYCDFVFIMFQYEYSIVYITVFYCMLLFVDNVIYFCFFLVISYLLNEIYFKSESSEILKNNLNEQQRGSM